MASEWYYTQNGQQAPAPVSSVQLKQLAASGQIKPTDLIWQQGMADWVPASTLKGLFGAGKPGTGELPVLDRGSAPRPTKPPRYIPEDVEEPGGSALTGLHPAIVLMLTACTGGIFGLVYGILVARAYARTARTRATDSAGRPLGRPRHPIWIFLFSYMTVGYYFSYWIYRVMQECSAYTGRPDPNLRTELCLMLVFPPYAVYLAVFRLPEMIRRVQLTAGLSETVSLGPSVLFLNPCMFCAAPFLGMLYQDILNHVWLSAP